MIEMHFFLGPRTYLLEDLTDIDLAHRAEPTSGITALLRPKFAGFACLLIPNVRVYAQEQEYRLSDLRRSQVMPGPRIIKEVEIVPPLRCDWVMVAYECATKTFSLETASVDDETRNADYWTSSRLFGKTFKGPFSPS